MFYNRSRHFNQAQSVFHKMPASTRYAEIYVLTSHAKIILTKTYFSITISILSICLDISDAHASSIRKSQNHTELHSPYIRNGTKMAARNGSPGCNPGSYGHTSKHGTFLGGTWRSVHCHFPHCKRCGTKQAVARTFSHTTHRYTRRHACMHIYHYITLYTLHCIAMTLPCITLH